MISNLLIVWHYSMTVTAYNLCIGNQIVIDCCKQEGITTIGYTRQYSDYKSGKSRVFGQNKLDMLHKWQTDGW